MKKISVDTIIFDFDGVLVESVAVKGEAFAALYESEGTEIQRQVLEYHHAHGGVSRFEKILHFEATLLKRPVTEQQVNILAEKFSDIVEEKVVRAQPVRGAVEFLEKYHARLPLFVVSATPEEELRHIVEKRGMNRFFKAVYGSPRSKAENIRRILDAYKYTAARTVMIGDTISDYKGAVETGTKFIGRIAPGERNIFPAETIVMPDLTLLADYLEF